MTEIGNLLQKVHTVPTAILTDTLPKKNALSKQHSGRNIFAMDGVERTTRH